MIPIAPARADSLGPVAGAAQRSALAPSHPLADRPLRRRTRSTRSSSCSGSTWSRRWTATSFGLLIPNIRDAFHMTDAGILSLVAVAALLGLSLTVPIAQMADSRNRVRLMLIGAAVFAFFSFGTGLAMFVWVLCIMRAGSGVGPGDRAAHPQLAAVGLVPDRGRGRASSRSTGSPTPSAPSSGPLLAGLLAAWIGLAGARSSCSPSPPSSWCCSACACSSRRGASRSARPWASRARRCSPRSRRPRSPSRGAWCGRSTACGASSTPCPSWPRRSSASPRLAALLYQQRLRARHAAQRSYIAAITEPVQIVGLIIGARFGTKLIMRDPALIMRFLAFAAFVCGRLRSPCSPSPPGCG